MSSTGSRKDPFSAFRFQVTIDSVSVAGFSECSGLKLETPMLAFAEGGLNSHEHQFPSASKQSNIVLKRGIADRRLWDWYWSLYHGEVKPRSGSIKVFDPSGTEVVMHWEFVDALPTSWEGPSLNASQGSVALETLTLVHYGLSRVR